jgi:mRNA interferase MazF
MTERLRRGNVVIAAERSDYGSKPRPMLIVQADKYLGRVDSLTICPITTTDTEAPLFRIPVKATEKNGLEEHCFISVDKLMTIRVAKIKKVAGSVSEEVMRSVDEALRRWLEL